MLKITLVLLLLPLAAIAKTAEEVLQQLDRRGLLGQSFEAEVLITPHRKGIAQDSTTYLMRRRSRSQVLVEEKLGKQPGNKYLTTDSGLFFLAPRTRKAIRIPPLLALRGRAAVGDIARLSLSEDYRAEDVPLPEGSCNNGESCRALSLKAKHEQATYARIELIVRQRNNVFEPIRAHLYVASGKLLKTVEYGVSEGNLPPPVRYFEAGKERDFTELRYLNMKAATFPAHWFNPRTLEI